MLLGSTKSKMCQIFHRFHHINPLCCSFSCSQSSWGTDRKPGGVSFPPCGACRSVWIKHIGLIGCLFSHHHHWNHNCRASRATPLINSTHYPPSHMHKQQIHTLCSALLVKVFDVRAILPPMSRPPWRSPLNYGECVRMCEFWGRSSWQEAVGPANICRRLQR